MKPKPDKRKVWQYRGCTIQPQKGSPKYFGCANFVPDSGCTQYRTLWWKIDFPDNTWVLCGTKNDCRAYVDSQAPGRGVANVQLETSNV